MRGGMVCGLALLGFLGCDSGARSGRGFRLPDGDAAAGQVVFCEMGCVQCHSVAGKTLPGEPEQRALHVALGGKVLQVRTYGQLVTAIVHPSHDLAKGYAKEEISVDGRSKMTDFNEDMTVQQLIDLVAFLQAQYQEYLPEDYDPYFP